ncbi:alpha-glucosidase C-terminal domain-containing protein [Wenjunlia tyrosinilytica]|uniref:Maltogenic amylase-like C-terminal domain-containing protein n=1 Tax=Wenjunlia tyrosinilytica TaxID=1544741 RepID=A0A918DUA5_9ACTN|nr:alpha-glucosidase C-terminal domain-containing protein [Wenjunlia tyrosinilytica]GGO84231.1 hypothetical protein GCM10012280_15230 [Wenjunlia tyrosinilytica]
MSPGTDAGTGRDMAALVEALARRSHDLVRLAECVSLAAAVEPAFLRRARLRFLPRSTAALEAELWFSPLVEAAGEHALLLDPEASRALWSRLARRPEHAAAVRRFTREAHAHAPRTTRLYEELLWAPLDPDGDQGKADHELGRLLRAVASDGRAADDLGRWALHYLPRLPEALREKENAWRVRVASAERLGLPVPEDTEAPDGDATHTARALVQRSIPFGVAAQGDGIVISRPPDAEAAVLRAAGGRKVRLDLSSTLSHTGEPVRLELEEGQVLHLPFTVVQRRARDGTLLASTAHPGEATDLVAAPEADDRSIGWAVLLADGTVVLHALDGRETGRVAPEEGGPPRRRIALSSGGHIWLTFLEGDRVRQIVLRSGEERAGPSLYQRVSADPRWVQLVGDRGSDVYWTDREGDSALLLRGNATGRVHRMAVAGGPIRVLWTTTGFAGSATVAAIDEHGVLRVWEAAGDRPALTLASAATALTGDPGGGLVAWADPDGGVWGWRKPDGGAASPRSWEDSRRFLIGQAPWPVTSLALGPDGRLAAAGGDSHILLWPTSAPDPDRLPLRIRLPFRASKVCAVPDGTWTIAGVGGPVEVRTEDGSRYLMTPDTEPASDVGRLPTWIRGCVLALAGPAALGSGPGSGLRGFAERLAGIANAGVTCVVVGPADPIPRSHRLHAPPLGAEPMLPLGFERDFAQLMTDVRRHGMRLVVDLDLSSVSGAGTGFPGIEVLDSVRRWLDVGVDGIRLVGGFGPEDSLLTDLRHLIDGYDDRALIGTTRQFEAAHRLFAPQGSGEQGCHVVVVSGLGGELTGRPSPQGHGEGSDGEDGHGEDGRAEGVGTGIQWLPLGAIGPQWGDSLPEGLTPGAKTLLAGLLLCLPGCPVLPLPLIQGGQDPAGVPLRRMVEQRRNQLALTRGDCRFLHAGHESVLAVLRRHGGEVVLCLANTAGQEVGVAFTAEQLGWAGPLGLLDLLGGDGVRHDGEREVAFRLAPGAMRWFRLHGPPGTG